MRALSVILLNSYFSSELGLSLRKCLPRVHKEAEKEPRELAAHAAEESVLQSVVAVEEKATESTFTR